MGTVRRFSVTSPSFDYVEPVLEDGSGPTYEANDWAEVEAPTVRAAKVLAVKAWRVKAKGKGWMNPPLPIGVLECTEGSSLEYCEGGLLNPFKGLKVEELFPCPIHEWDSEGCADEIYEEDGQMYMPCRDGHHDKIAAEILGDEYFA